MQNSICYNHFMDKAHDIGTLIIAGQAHLEEFHQAGKAVDRLTSQLKGLAHCIERKPEAIELQENSLRYGLYNSKQILSHDTVGQIAALIRQQHQLREELFEVNERLAELGVDPLGGSDFIRSRARVL